MSCTVTRSYPCSRISEVRAFPSSPRVRRTRRSMRSSGTRALLADHLPRCVRYQTDHVIWLLTCRLMILRIETCCLETDILPCSGQSVQLGEQDGKVRRPKTMATTSPLRGVSTVSFFAADHVAARRWYTEFLVWSRTSKGRGTSSSGSVIPA